MLKHLCSKKDEKDRTIKFQGLLTGTISQEEALSNTDPQYFIKVLLKIKLSGGALTGKHNNTCMVLNKHFSSNKQTKVIFYQPEMTFNRCSYNSHGKMYTFEITHVPSDFLEVPNMIEPCLV